MTLKYDINSNKTQKKLLLYIEKQTHVSDFSTRPPNANIDLIPPPIFAYHNFAKHDRRIRHRSEFRAWPKNLYRKINTEIKTVHSYSMRNWKVHFSKPIVPDFPRRPGATFLRPRHCLFYVLQIFEFSLLVVDHSSGGLSWDDDAHLRLDDGTCVCGRCGYRNFCANYAWNLIRRCIFCHRISTVWIGEISIFIIGQYDFV